MNRTTTFRLMATAGLATAGLVLGGCAGGGGAGNAGPAVPEGPWTFDGLRSAEWGGQPEPFTFESVADGEGEGMRLCVLLPHVKDQSWVAIAEGVYVEAQRTAVSYDIYEAGGYENLPTQLAQMEDCITSGDYDAIILNAISGDGSCSMIGRAMDAGIAVVDSINGTECGEEITGSPLFTQVAIKYYDLAKQLAERVVEENPGEEKKIIALVGPEGVPWSDNALRAFEEVFAANPGNEIIAAPRGDMDANLQLSLATDALAAYPEATDIMSVAVAASAAMVAIRDAGAEDRVNLHMWSSTEDTYLAIPEGGVKTLASDVLQIQARMGVNQAIRLVQADGAGLEEKSISPLGVMIDADNFDEVKRTDVTASAGFRPVFNYKPE